MISLCLHAVVRLRPDLLSLPFVQAFLIVQISTPYHLSRSTLLTVQANYSDMYYLTCFLPRLDSLFPITNLHQ